MRVWQKIYLIVLIIVAIFFNIAMYFVIQLNYKEEIKSAKERAATDQQFVSTSFYKDLSNVEKNDTLTYDSVILNFQVYQNFYEEQGIYLELWNNQKLFSENKLEVKGDRGELRLNNYIQNIVIREIEGEPYIFVAGNVSEPYDSYTIVLATSMENVIKARQTMIQLMIGLDFLFMLLLAVILFIIIKTLMKPLKVLSQATKVIAEGNFDSRIELHTKDELGELAEQFNSMSKSISQKVDALSKESESRKLLIDNMAHELRSPLTAALGYMDYLMMANVSEEERIEVLEYTSSEIKRLNKLSNTLLKMASIREEMIEYQEIDTSAMIERLQYLFNKRISPNEICLKFQSEIKRLHGNQEMLEMLLTNLIENAFRACDKGGGIIVNFLENKEGTIIEVIDTGVGMDPSELEKVTTPFYRVDKMRSRKNGGVGLGLALCQQIAEYHNARITLESQLGKGTKVSILFTT
ncbi:sensor histidine kinase [Lachnoclostridium sp.]|uniref:sensor histidine kinase n=1 Tax=Lachnoclostridium sp. TaxID=2028282 RepID=UPI00289630D6|nr:HAMP domain-containing sensor histidine kinase [Lachnoclostridium sp.]